MEYHLCRNPSDRDNDMSVVFSRSFRREFGDSRVNRHSRRLKTVKPSDFLSQERLDFVREHALQ